MSKPDCPDCGGYRLGAKECHKPCLYGSHKRLKEKKNG